MTTCRYPHAGNGLGLREKITADGDGATPAVTKRVLRASPITSSVVGIDPIPSVGVVTGMETAPGCERGQGKTATLGDLIEIGLLPWREYSL